MNITRHAAAAALACATALVAVPGAATAAAPTNDTHAGAIGIASVPFSTTQDTTEATTDAADDELNAECGAPAMDASVWFSYTATADGALVADASGSDYSAGVFVATGAPGSFVVVACAPGATSWETVAGETYSIVVIDDQSDGGGNGGSMSLVVDEVPPPPEISVDVDPTGTFTAAGNAIISGTAVCEAGAFDASIDVDVTQTVGRLKIRGFGFAPLTCDGTPQRWSAEVVADNGVFRGGRTVTVTVGFACGDFDCGVDFQETTVRLNGKRR